MLILNIPYPAIFRSTPASIIETAVGASVWASGNQLCRGQTGSFTANATRKKIKIKAVVRGDQNIPSISAASIIAKVKRDNYMKLEVANKFPNYKFENNKGYGTKEHINALKLFGITEIHRKSFEPIKSMIKD